jgi:hypothetical protein
MFKLYKVYFPYKKKRVVMHLYIARNESEVAIMTGFNKFDKPQPIIKEIPFEEGCCMCHHIADSGLYDKLKAEE